MHGVWYPMPELTTVDSNTFSMSIEQPYASVDLEPYAIVDLNPRSEST
jgi:hypothetical protein